MAKSKSVQQHVIGVTVTFTYGIPQYGYTTLLGKTADSPEEFPVGTGDQVAWYVTQVDAGPVVSHPPYELTFSNPSVFGTSSLSVPAGGFSPFLQALAFQGNTKYTLAVKGVNPPSDPTIEIDNGSPLTGGLAIASFEILWDGTPNGAPQWRTSGGQLQNFPMTPLNLGDQVTFLSPSVPAFQIKFDPIPPVNAFNGEKTSFTIPGIKGSTQLQTEVCLSAQTFGFVFMDLNSTNTSAHEQLTTN
jgi:hypothetical protein